MDHFNEKRIKRNDEWMANVLIPLTETLGNIEEIEKSAQHLSRIEFFQNKDGHTELIQGSLIRMSERLADVKEADPKLLEKYDYIPWDKYIKIGKWIVMGRWPLIYQKAWKLATEGIVDIKNIILELLESENPEPDLRFF